MSNTSLVDYLKMAAGFNRHNSGRGMEGDRNISPWIQHSNNANQFTSPIPHNQQLHIPEPPPPPTFRFDDNSSFLGNRNHRDNSVRNPPEERSNSYYNSNGREFRNYECMNNGDRHYEQYTSQNTNSGTDRDRYQRYEKEDRRHSDRRNHSSNISRRRYSGEKHKDRRNQYKERDDVELISLTPNSHSETSDRSIGSPDVIEVQNSPANANLQEVQDPRQSQLGRAYNRRLSQSSDTSEISVIPNQNLVSHRTHVRNDEIVTRRQSDSYNTPASPDR